MLYPSAAGMLAVHCCKSLSSLHVYGRLYTPQAEAATAVCSAAGAACRGRRGSAARSRLQRQLWLPQGGGRGSRGGRERRRRRRASLGDDADDGFLGSDLDLAVPQAQPGRIEHQQRPHIALRHLCRTACRTRPPSAPSTRNWRDVIASTTAAELYLCPVEDIAPPSRRGRPPAFRPSSFVSPKLDS